MFRLIVLAGALLASASSFASFELALVADQGSIGGRNWIHRYDVDSGVYMGRFDVGNGGLTIVSTHLYPGTANLGVGFNNGAFRTYNIWSGELINEFLLSSTSVAFNDSGTKAALFDGFPDFVVRDFAANSSYVAGAAPGNISYRGGIFARGSNDIIGLNATSPTSTRVTLTRNATGNAVVLGTIAASVVDSRSIARVGGNGQYTILQSGVATRYDISSDVLVSSLTLATPVTGWNATAAAEAHVGNLVYGTASGVGGIARYGTVSSIDNRYFATPQVVNGTHLRSFLAPEPGTLIALGLGVAAICRRRMRRVRS